MCAQVQLELCQVLQACLLCYACQQYDYTVCRDCWYDKHANTRRHRSFLSVEPPTGVIANTNEGLASHCCQKQAFYHCNSCLNRECVSLCPRWPKLLTLDSALKLSQRVSLCKTRYIQFSERVFYCENCNTHDSAHNAWTWSLEDRGNGNKPRFDCSICNTREARHRII